ncbi:MAG: VOC family protein [Hyphomicrobiales bacterium]|nr:MAG: VOC family protein [Hyphomicrobiales bacterium]
MSRKIMPCLWFDDRIDEAVKFYVEVFKDAEIHKTQSYPDGRTLTMTFRLKDQEFMALNGGPVHPFTEAISFTVDCKDQAEVDYYWGRLLEDGGREDRCGWLKDRFGLSWQIVPEALPRLLASPDRAASGRVMEAMLQMIKIDVPTLEKAAAGG